VKVLIFERYDGEGEVKKSRKGHVMRYGIYERALRTQKELPEELRIRLICSCLAYLVVTVLRFEPLKFALTW